MLRKVSLFLFVSPSRLQENARVKISVPSAGRKLKQEISAPRPKDSPVQCNFPLILGAALLVLFPPLRTETFSFNVR